MNKGFVFSADSIAAITLLSLLIIVSFIYLYQINPDAWNSVDLTNAVRDELSILEKSQILEQAVRLSSAEPILENLNSSPSQYCFEALIFNQTNLSVPVIHSLKTGCGQRKGSIVSVERTLVVNNDNNVSFFVVNLKGWFK